MSWYRLSVQVPGALADALAWLLAERTGLPCEVRDAGTLAAARDSDAQQAEVLCGLEAEPGPELVRGIRLDLERLGLDPDAVPIQSSRSDDESWRLGWRAFFRGGPVADRLYLRPPWEEPGPAAAGRQVIVIDPGMAFGTGTHATTRGVLELLDRRLAARPGVSVLDVGSGSGILCIAAALLGSEPVGVEIDPDALPNARENLDHNPAIASRVRLIEGTAADVEGVFELVLANILAPILITEAAPIAARAASELILSGLLEEQEARVRAAYPDFVLVERALHGEWVVLHLRRAVETSPSQHRPDRKR